LLTRDAARAACRQGILRLCTSITSSYSHHISNSSVQPKPPICQSISTHTNHFNFNQIQHPKQSICLTLRKFFDPKPAALHLQPSKSSLITIFFRHAFSLELANFHPDVRVSASKSKRRLLPTLRSPTPRRLVKTSAVFTTRLPVPYSQVMLK
jgi:hypothetical protein